MVFSAPIFLFVFLPLTLLVWGVAVGADRLRGQGQLFQNTALLVNSLVFYAFGAGVLLGIMATAIGVSAIAALVIEKTSFRRSALGVAVVVQLGLLAWYKYANFFAAQYQAVVEPKDWQWTTVVLPIGISFFVFQAISYCIDVYRGTSKALRNPLDVALYVALFPQLIAGPIVRYQDVAAQMRDRTVTIDDVTAGLVRFLYGLCKKVLIADTIGAVVDASFAVHSRDLTTASVVVAAVAYVFQIYFDFSAYSDMAIGLGRLFGFRFPENFRRPYSSSSITDFWRRWHITLSNWFRDYVYIPLGGSRHGPGRTYAHLWIVFLLSGLWHGANWTFIIWGAFHGALLTLERIFNVPVAGSGVWRRGLTFVLVTLGFLIFRAESVYQAKEMLGHIVSPTTWTLPFRVIDQLTHRALIIGALAALSLSLPREFVTGRWLESSTSTAATLGRLALIPISVLTLGVIASSNFSPFLYFQF